MLANSGFEQAPRRKSWTCYWVNKSKYWHCYHLSGKARICQLITNKLEAFLEPLLCGRYTKGTKKQTNKTKTPMSQSPQLKGAHNWVWAARGRNGKVTDNMSSVWSCRFKQNLKVQKKEGAPMDSGVGTGFGAGSARRKGEDCHGSPQWNTAEHGGHIIWTEEINQSG